MTQRTILRAGELDAAIKASNRIQLGIAFWLAIMVASIFAIINPATRADGIVFPGSIIAFTVSVSSIILSALRVRNLQSLTETPLPPREDPPDNNDASDLLTFEQQQRLMAELAARNQQMEAVEGNTIRLGKIKLDSGTWGDLADVLYSHGWRWRRDIVAEAGVFRSLSGRFPAITAEMINIDFIEGRPRKQTITLRGRHWFVDQSPNLFLEHVRI